MLISVKYLSMFFIVMTGLLNMEACGPGAMYGGRRKRLPRKLTPLVLKESYPSFSEFSIGASGPFTTHLTQDHNRFRELVPNYNTDISFQDSEGSGEDHLMSRRCKEKLDTLAISTMNQYPGVRLRVLEAYDTENVHQEHSLHYEGRAVDLSVSDRDRSKLGMLARLAIEAGFDYVNYKSKSHIHASVKSESSDISRTGGCFPANATVDTPTGKKRMANLKIGDLVLSSTVDGVLTFSPVLLFLHRDATQKRVYIVITTEKKEQIILTSSHLIYITDEKTPTIDIASSYVTFAKNVEIGHFVFVKNNSSQIELQKVVNVTAIVEKEHYAPLTEEGSIVVNNVVASCYAMIESQEIAHAAFQPMRMLLNSKKAALHFLRAMNCIPFKTNNGIANKVDSENAGGVHWYAELLYKMSYYILPENYIYN